jgi:alpha-1,3-mannosyltransferase
MTNNGTDIVKGQYIFLGLYLCTFLVVAGVFMSSKAFPVLSLVPLVLSKRIHSIYMLRMFNDCVAVFYGYLALYCYVKGRYRLGCVLYSLGVSVKMNMLLQAPGVLLVLLAGTGLAETVICLSICATVQLVLGFPFLTTFPVEYISKSFELSRVFMYKWTVNLKFLPEDIFVSKALSIGLLVGTIFGKKSVCQVYSARMHVCVKSSCAYVF